ncbi:MAG: hypothetical protein ACR2PS_00285 [Pseudomonadales bacterium]
MAKIIRYAFPNQALGDDGMTMRQYYKAAALSGINIGRFSSEIGRRSKGKATEKDVAKGVAFTAALIADAMIAEDEEHEGS